MNQIEIANKLLEYIETQSKKCEGNYDSVFQDAAVFGSSFLRLNPETMTYEIVPTDEIYVTKDSEGTTPLPPPKEES